MFVLNGCRRYQIDYNTVLKIMETGLGKKKLGSNIDSWCGKCKLMLAHTIEAMVGEKPMRVSCNTCRSQHSYRPQPPRSDSRSAAKREVSGGSPKSGKPIGKRYQSLLKAKDAAVVKTYASTNKYEVGDVLEHPMFGRGVATAVKDA